MQNGQLMPAGYKDDWKLHLHNFTIYRVRSSKQRPALSKMDKKIEEKKECARSKTPKWRGAHLASNPPGMFPVSINTFQNGVGLQMINSSGGSQTPKYMMTRGFQVHSGQRSGTSSKITTCWDWHHVRAPEANQSCYKWVRTCMHLTPQAIPFHNAHLHSSWCW